MAFAGHAHDPPFAINDNRPPAVDGHQGRRSVEVIQAIYESAKQGQIVKL